MTAQLAEGPRSSALRPVDRFLVSVFASVLPTHFRARQRAEWMADLLILSRHGASARWRYLLGAARTLPTLRALASRAEADGPQQVLPAAAPWVVIVARVLAISLTWAVLSWLIMLPGRYFFYDIPAQLGDPEIWPAGEQPFYLLPLLVILYWGALAATMDFPLVPVIGLIAAVFVLLQKRQPWQERVRVAILRVAVIALVAVVVTAFDFFVALMTTGAGLTFGIAGATAVSLGGLGLGLSKPTRVLLVIIGVAAVAVVVVNHTVGSPMVVWFHD